MYEAPKSFFPQCTFTDALGCTPNHKMNIFTECNHFRLCKAFAAQLGNQKSSFCQEKSSSAMLHIMILHSSRTLNTICKLSLNKQTQKEKKIQRPNRVGPVEMQTRGVCKSAIEIINGQARRAATETGLSCCRNNPSSS